MNTRASRGATRWTAVAAAAVLVGSLVALAVDPGDDTTTATVRPTTTSTEQVTSTTADPSTSTTSDQTTSTASAAPPVAAPMTAAPTVVLSRPVVFARNSASAFEVWMMAGDGSGQRRIDSYSQPTEAGSAECGATWPIAHKLRDWSPDGRRFFVIDECTPSGSEAQLYDRAGRKLHRIPLIPGQGTGDTDAAWSPDGTQIVAADENVNRLTIVDVASGRVVRRIEGLATHYIGWAPSTRIVLMGIDTLRNVGGLFTVNPDGSDRRRVASAQFQGRPQWSRDGRILFRYVPPGEYRPEDPSTHHRVAVAPDRVDAPVTRLCGGDAADFDWAPDDKSVVAAVLTPAVARVTVCPPDGGAGRTVAEGVNPVFDAEGRVLFARDGDTWSVAADGTGLRRLAAGGPPVPAPN